MAVSSSFSNSNIVVPLRKELNKKGSDSMFSDAIHSLVAHNMWWGDLGNTNDNISTCYVQEKVIGDFAISQLMKSVLEVPNLTWEEKGQKILTFKL